jgi:hypothetical protein
MPDEIASYRQAVQALLHERDEGTWAEQELDAALRAALVELSHWSPQRRSAELALSEGGWEIPLAGLAGLLWVEEIWLPYSSGSEPCPVPFEQREGRARLRTCLPASPGEVVRVLYAAIHTIAGLDGAQETSLPAALAPLLAQGAAGFAALAKAAAMAREYSWPAGAAAQMTRWGSAMLASFRQALSALREPATAPWVSWG